MLWWRVHSALIALLALLATGLAGCGVAGSFFGNAGAEDSERVSAEAGPADTDIDAQGLAVYLELMRRLAAGDAVTQADTFADAADAVELAPTTTNRLKYALALAAPGHAGSDARAAERELTSLLAENTLLPEERVLAEIHLAEVSRRLVLSTSAERLREELAQARAEQDSQSTERLQAALEQNRQLRRQLEDATEKLEAITSIEQSIRERDNEPAELPQNDQQPD